MRVLRGVRSWYVVREYYYITRKPTNQPTQVRTAALEDKSTACRMLACFVADMKETYNPYVDATMRIVAPLSKDSCYDDIRLACLASLPDMLKIVRCVRARSARILIVSLKYYEQHCITHRFDWAVRLSSKDSHNSLHLLCNTFWKVFKMI